MPGSIEDICDRSHFDAVCGLLSLGGCLVRDHVDLSIGFVLRTTFGLLQMGALHERAMQPDCSGRNAEGERSAARLLRPVVACPLPDVASGRLLATHCVTNVLVIIHIRRGAIRVCKQLRPATVVFVRRRHLHRRVSNRLRRRPAAARGLPPEDSR